MCVIISGLCVTPYYGVNEGVVFSAQWGSMSLSIKNLECNSSVLHVCHFVYVAELNFSSSGHA